MRTAIFIAALLTSNLAFARCEYPQQLEELPDGDTATKEQMLDGQKAIKSYLGEMEAFLDCLASEDEALTDQEGTEEQRSIIAARHNAAVDEMEATGERFNQSVRAYRARADH